jgi:hypothetical protein
MCSQQTDQLIQIQQTDQLIKISQTDPPIKISPAEQLIRAQQKEQLLKGQTTKNGHGFMVVSGASRLGKYLYNHLYCETLSTVYLVIIF